MKKLVSTTIILFLISTLGVISSSAQQKETRDVKDFTGVSLSIAANIYLTQANSYKVELVADADLLEKIETVVDGNTLKIKRRNNLDWSWSNKKVLVYITMPQVEKLSISGSGDIVAQTPINSNRLDMGISGSGDIKIEDLSVKAIDVSISGSGDILLAGKNISESATYSVSGSGDIRAEGLQCKKVEVHVSGSGDVRVWAVDELNSKVSGSGDVYYKGRPLINSKSSGSGGFHSLGQ